MEKKTETEIIGEILFPEPADEATRLANLYNASLVTAWIEMPIDDEDEKDENL
jgi:hypothetical protein